MFLEFPFKYYRVEGVGRLFSPIVRVGLETVFGWQDFEFLVDTGADISLINYDLFEKLKHKYKQNLKESFVYGIGETPAKVRDLKLDIRFGNQIVQKVTFAAIHVNGAQPLLLGRKDIFEKRFNLLIDSQKQSAVITSNVVK